MLGAVLLVVAWVIWFVRTPDDLPVSTRTSEGTGVVGQPVYVGMFATGDDFDRTLHISEVVLDVTPEDDVEVTPLICRNGSISVTTDADSYCESLDDPEGEEFHGGDSIVAAVSASAPTTVEIGRIEIAFREGIRWGTKPAGAAGATLDFAEHTPGTIQEGPEPDDSTTGRPEEHQDSEDERDKKKDDQTDDTDDEPGAIASLMS